VEVLDNFGFALRAAEASEDEGLAKGVRLVHEQLLEVLRRSGLEEVPGVGAPFDPAHHEALLSEADDVEREHPEIGEVLRTGYRYKSALLRPASVKVLE
jgi:molecular chaperone GrpE